MLPTIRRLRSKVTALFLLLVLTGVLGSTIFTVRTFVSDKRNYVTQLNAIVAPHVAVAVGKRLDHLQDQFVAFHEILKIRNSNIHNSGMSGVIQLDIFLRDMNTASENPVKSVVFFDKTKPGFSLKSEDLKSIRKTGVRSLSAIMGSNKSGAVLFLTATPKWIYAAWIWTDAFIADMEMDRALKVVLLDAAGTILASNKPLETGQPDLGVLTAIQDYINQPNRPQAFAQEITQESDRRSLVTLAFVPATLGSVVMVEAPSAEVSRMISHVLKDSLPFVLGILFLTVLMGVVFSARLARPIEELTSATARMAKGDWSVLMRPKSRDEIGRLIFAFNRMGDELALRELKLNKANESLIHSEKLASLGQFSAGIAHEVKNPLSSILGYAQIIQRKLGNDTDETVIKFLGFIVDETKRAAKIISDLLIFARQKPPVLIPAQVEPSIDKVIELMAPEAVLRKIKLLKSVDAPDRKTDTRIDARAAFDADQLHQVLLNLITNSFHAFENQPEGVIKKITLSLQKKDSFVVISVCDTGPGIPPENLSRLFEPFFSTKGVGKGSGLGLSLCYGIIQQHRGKIEVTSKSGTTFHVFLPLIDEATQ